jgi:hypothetical protein
MPVDRLSVGDLDFDFEIGPRVSVIHHTPSGWGIEWNFFWLEHSSDAAFAVADPLSPDLVLAVDEAISLSVLDSSFLYSSDLYSAELNFRRPIGWFTPLIGARWVGLYEDYRVSGLDIAPSAYTLSYETENNLIGGQLGGELDFWNQGGIFRLKGFGKFGIYCGINEMDAALTNYDSTSDDDTDVAFVGEMGLLASVQVTHSMAIRGGYQLLWINGVALATDQIGSTDIANEAATSINNDGDPFYHGPVAGFEFVW